MRRVRGLIALACVSGGALLIGAAAPAQAAPAMHFGTYYTYEYCVYYGVSLTSGPSFDYYSCQAYWYPNDPTQYWALYVW